VLAEFEPQSTPCKLRADLCIVGAGAAGLALAAQFLNTQWRVVVLESGLRDPDPMADELNQLDSVGLRHDGWREGRTRAFGGTTRAWGGQLVPMRESELAERAWVPGSGWPLSLEELQPHYRRVEQLLRVTGPPYDSAMWQRLRINPPTFDPELFCVRFSQWAALGRRNFALLWRRELERSSNVTIMLDATATAVVSTADGKRCDRVDIRSRKGGLASVSARYYVVASGGIETARLLLASPSPGGNGVANSSGLVGRFFQDHISFVAGELESGAAAAVRNLFDPRYVGSTMYSAKIEPTDAVMRSQGWLNVMGHIAFQIPDALGWMEMRKILRSIQAGRLEIPSLHETRALARGGVELTRLLLARVLSRRRRSPTSAQIRMLVDTEQAPNNDSRVLLGTDRDVLGMPRARLDWRVGELELRTLSGFARSLAAEFERLGLGRFRLADVPDFGTRDALGSARDIFHHMGTTRMGVSPRTAVTRPDLRCHDVENLFIAGPSVFPAGGIANPTFTALALTLRLGDDLKAMLFATAAPPVCVTSAGAASLA
jgi:choline dehydrogenase-like flavoprotein